MVSTHNYTVEPPAKAGSGCIYNHTTLPLFYYAVVNKTNNGFNYTYDYGNGFTSTASGNLTSDYCVDSACNDALLPFTHPTRN